MNHYGVIMAGGGGTRFWPLSRQKTPKQLLNLSGRDLMLNEAVERMATVIGKSNIFIITADSQASAIIQATQGKVFPGNILAEPDARDTTACIGYAAMEILRKYGDGVMVITPSDHYIRDLEALTEAFRIAIVTAEEQDKLVTIGIRPTFPSTGFGYIQYDSSAAGRVKPVTEFREKPDEATARGYVESGKYTWNSGMFIWKASLILKKIEDYAPDIFRDLKSIGDAMNTPKEQEVLHDIYPNIRKISIDYSVLEPCSAKGDILVIPAEFGWNDVGSWDMMGILHEPDENGNVLLGDTMTLGARNCVIYSGSRIVTALDVEDLIVVETPDAVMVCSKRNAQDVKKIVDRLKEQDRKELL